MGNLFMLRSLRGWTGSCPHPDDIGGAGSGLFDRPDMIAGAEPWRVQTAILGIEGNTSIASEMSLWDEVVMKPACEKPPDSLGKEDVDAEDGDMEAEVEEEDNKQLSLNLSCKSSIFSYHTKQMSASLENIVSFIISGKNISLCTFKNFVS